jgi:alpha-L-rhamnosidase
MRKSLSRAFFPVFLLSTTVGSCLAGDASAAPRAENLLCEYTLAPLGVDKPHPRFSWSVDSDLRDHSQTAYRILVSTTRESLADGTGDVWDSGRVASGDSHFVRYEGPELKSRTRYYWKVKLWDNKGEEFPFSDPASFGTGFLDEDDWVGEWIQSDLELFEYQKELKKMPDDNMEEEKPMWRRGPSIREMTKNVKEAPAAYMRRDFKPEKGDLKYATLYISGLGLYEAYLNGEKINDRALKVSPHNFQKSVPYHAHDVTDLIKTGDNALGVILGNGYFNPVIPSLLREYTCDFIDTPRLRCELKLVYDDGSSQLISSDEHWRFTADGPITFNSIRSGETYDARKELGDWSSAGFDDQDWSPARPAEGPEGRLRYRNLPPVRVVESLPAVSVEKLEEEDAFRFDIGEANTGWARLKVRGEKGRKIRVYFEGHDSHTLGRYQIFEYICKGEGEEVFEPRFAFAGYRHVRVDGLGYTPEASDLTGLKVVSDYESIGSFACSEERINILHDVNRLTHQNYNVTMPMDPVREKSCWTQDVQTNFHSVAYNFKVYSVYDKWQEDYLDCIHPNGFVPTVVPSCFDGPTVNGPWWGGMIIYNPWQLYHFYGDKDILAKSYASMKQHLAYLDSIAEENIIEWGLGDWLDIALEANQHTPRPKRTPVAYTSSTAYFLYTDILRQVAVLLGEEEDAEYFEKRKEEIRQSINRKFFDPETASYSTGSQTTFVHALKFGIPDEKDRARVIESFRNQITKDDDHITSGFVGTPYLLTLLTEIGLGDKAWAIATQDTYPSWYDMIFNRGKTAFDELWNGAAVQMPSLAGPIGAYFFRSLGGIRSGEPGFRSVVVNPYTETLDWVKCEFEGPYGPIMTDWSRKGEKLTLKVSIPFNSSAIVHIDGDEVMESGVKASKAKGVTFLREEGGKSVFEVQSGNYTFVSK